MQARHDPRRVSKALSIFARYPDRRPERLSTSEDGHSLDVDSIWRVWGRHHHLSQQDLLHDITRHAFGDSGQRRFLFTSDEQARKWVTTAAPRTRRQPCYPRLHHRRHLPHLHPVAVGSCAKPQPALYEIVSVADSWSSAVPEDTYNDEDWDEQTEADLATTEDTTVENQDSTLTEEDQVRVKTEDANSSTTVKSEQHGDQQHDTAALEPWASLLLCTGSDPPDSRFPDAVFWPVSPESVTSLPSTNIGSSFDITPTAPCNRTSVPLDSGPARTPSSSPQRNFSPSPHVLALVATHEASLVIGLHHLADLAPSPLHPSPLADLLSHCLVCRPASPSTARPRPVGAQWARPSAKPSQAPRHVPREMLSPGPSSAPSASNSPAPAPALPTISDPFSHLNPSSLAPRPDPSPSPPPPPPGAKPNVHCWADRRAESPATLQERFPRFSKSSSSHMSKPPSAPTRDSASLSQPSFFAPAGSDSSGFIPKTCRDALNSWPWLHSLHSLVPLWWLFCLPLSLPSVWVLGFHPFGTWGGGGEGGVGRVAIFSAVRLPVSWENGAACDTNKSGEPAHKPLHGEVQCPTVLPSHPRWRGVDNLCGMEANASVFGPSVFDLDPQVGIRHVPGFLRGLPGRRSSFHS